MVLRDADQAGEYGKIRIYHIIRLIFAEFDKYEAGKRLQADVAPALVGAEVKR